MSHKTDHQHTEEDHHDEQIGQLLTRREALKLLGGAGAVLVTGMGFTQFGAKSLNLVKAQTPTATALPACVVRPALTEGPYFVDVMLNRSDIRAASDGTLKEGKLLNLKFYVSDVTADACKPFEGVQVDIWHCDANGVYSGVTDPGFDTSQEYWLRGYQVTDENGVAEFVTIYPGWYSGRTTHIHFKLRTDPDADQGYEFTSQLFFPEDLTDIVQGEAPYADKGYRDTLNENDGIFQSSEGLLTLELTDYESEDGEQGYQAIFNIGIDTSQPVIESGIGGGNGGPGNGGGRPPSGGNGPAGSPPPNRP